MRKQEKKRIRSFFFTCWITRHSISYWKQLRENSRFLCTWTSTVAKGPGFSGSFCDSVREFWNWSNSCWVTLWSGDSTDWRWVIVRTDIELLRRIGSFFSNRTENKNNFFLVVNFGLKKKKNLALKKNKRGREGNQKKKIHDIKKKKNLVSILLFSSVNPCEWQSHRFQTLYALTSRDLSNPFFFFDLKNNSPFFSFSSHFSTGDLTRKCFRVLFLFIITEKRKMAKLFLFAVFSIFFAFWCFCFFFFCEPFFFVFGICFLNTHTHTRNKKKKRGEITKQSKKNKHFTINWGSHFESDERITNELNLTEQLTSSSKSWYLQKKNRINKKKKKWNLG